MYITEQSPEHAHNAVHLSAALVHLQRPVHPFSQPQWISLSQDFDASGSVVQRGCHPETSFVQPQSDGIGNSGFRTRVWFQQLPWRDARLMCCWSAACFGGMFSRARDLCARSCFLASFTSMVSLVRVFMLCIQRVETLLVEYKQKDKVNSFIDRRFGEFNPNMTVEEKMTKRFMMEHQRQLKKSDLFNLNKDEELTHYGRSLADGQGMTDFIESADDDDPDDRGLLSGKVFPFLSCQNEVFARYVSQLYEQQNERERAQDLTKKLDEQWKDIRLLLTHKGAEDKVESYDMVVRELGFEMKAQPTDRLKSAEELARQEQQRLQSLEADRLRRMRGEKATVASRRRKHESADDLHDDFHVEHHERTLLSYQKAKEEFGDDGDDHEEEGSGVESDGEEENMSNETDGNSLLDFESKSDEASSAEEDNVESEKVLGQNECDKSEKVESIQRMKTMCEAEGELPYVFAGRDGDVFSIVVAEYCLPSLILQLLFLKLISIIFPTSDFRHPVVTPAMVYMSQVLTQCPVQNLRQLSVGLFVCNLFLEFVSLSRRLVPELLTFLHGSLGQALPQLNYLIFVRFVCFFLKSILLGLKCIHSCNNVSCRISALALTLELIRDCVKLYNGLPAFPELFHPIKVLLTQHLKLNNYPTPELAKVVCHSLTTPRTLTPMVYQKQKPTPIQMFHPKVDYESGHKKSGRKEELKQFQRHYQRELKGAVRELRKDNQFLARQQLAEHLERDAERRRKVKEIRHLLSTQEGEYKAMKKKYVNV
uniref:NOP14 nucleolar protein homolog (yeast) n=1 Tax=Eptatretus burgeri TaxID=7764 RepID=A0A8C4PZH6_EPTBU